MPVQDGLSASELLARAHAAALTYIARVDDSKVGARASAEDLRAALGGPLPERGEPSLDVLDALIAGVEPGLVHATGPRYFGFVVGGVLPVALATDWLTSTWDQNAFGYVLSPASSVVEEIVEAWLLDLLALPKHASVGFVTGGQMANFTCLCAARDAVLRRSGHDLERDGLGSAQLTVFVSAAGHSTIHTALRMLGIGRSQVRTVEADQQGRMRPDSLREQLAGHEGPAIVCAQAGNVNTGAFDDFAEIIAIARTVEAWVHVDGAFGLWAACSESRRRHLRGVERADSWAVDGHKWLNVPYDSGFAIVADRRAHYDALRTQTAAYLVREPGERDGSDWVPEASRRARAFAVYAVLRTLGRAGLADLIDRNCEHAQLMARLLASTAGAQIANEVVLNQVLARFDVHGGDPAQSDALTQAVIATVQREGVCWVGPTHFEGRLMMRVSVSSWKTSEQDVERAADSIASAARLERLLIARG
ncbi:MAG: PLP-dependent enzyme glutamate decarboxylase [Myxococcaceae bacterium]|nr:PLP-dependent enzyme glutamate decarboxylase [Myxococcaceae bacterium]